MPHLKQILLLILPIQFPRRINPARMRINANREQHLRTSPGCIPRRNPVHNIRIRPLIRIVRLHLNNTIPGRYTLRHALLKQRRVKPRRVIVHIFDVDQELRGVRFRRTAPVLGTDHQTVAALHLVIERLDQSHVAAEAVDGELGLYVAADDGVAYCGIVALIGVGGFYVGYDRVACPIDVFVDEDGVGALGELGVVVVVVQDADDNGCTGISKHIQRKNYEALFGN